MSIFTYINTYIYLQIINSKIIISTSSEKNYIYFLLPNDIFILRSRQYYDQFKFIKNLIKYIYKLVIPSFIGHYDFVIKFTYTKKQK